MKRCNGIIAILSSFLIFLFMVGFFFLPKVVFSENENRYLEKFPSFQISSFLKGKYTERLNAYVNDHFPFRDFWVGIQSKGEVILGKSMIDDVYLGADSYLLKRYYAFTRKDELVSVLNSFYQSLNYINMSLLLVPSSISINQDKLPAYAITDDELKDIASIYYDLNFNSISVLDILKQGNQDYPMFYRLDHHWTSYGAYYAYLEYCHKNDLDAMPITAFDIQKVSDSFKGTLYSRVHLYDYSPDSIHVFVPKNSHYQVRYVMENRVTDTLYEESYLKKKDQYSYFLDNNHPLIEITNLDSTSDKEIVVIKDSFANSFIPFLVQHYAKVHVIDPRFYKDSIITYIKEHSAITDVLFLYNMQSLEKDLGIYYIH